MGRGLAFFKQLRREHAARAEQQQSHLSPAERLGFAREQLRRNQADQQKLGALKVQLDFFANDVGVVPSLSKHRSRFGAEATPSFVSKFDATDLETTPKLQSLPMQPIVIRKAISQLKVDLADMHSHKAEEKNEVAGNSEELVEITENFKPGCPSLELCREQGKLCLAAVAAARHANLQGSGAMAIVRVERGGLARREGSS
jgi:hypothetical protein